MSKLTIEMDLEMPAFLRIMVDGEPVGMLQSLSLKADAKTALPEIEMVAYDYGMPEDYTNRYIGTEKERAVRDVEEKTKQLDALQKKLPAWVKFTRVTPGKET